MAGLAFGRRLQEFNVGEVEQSGVWSGGSLEAMTPQWRGP
jgi:hypothetical protein